MLRITTATSGSESTVEGAIEREPTRRTGTRDGRAAASRARRPASPQTLAATTEDREGVLVARLRGGDATAYDEVVRTLGGSLLAMARRLVRNEEEARDVVQEALLSAFRGLDRFCGEASLSTWLYRITTNAALMRLRHRRRFPEASLDDVLPRFAETGLDDATVASADPPADALESHQLRSAVRRCIARLPESYRRVVVLREVDDLTTAETAQALGITEGAVKLRLHRARLALGDLLEDELAEPRSPHPAGARNGRSSVGIGWATT